MSNFFARVQAAQTELKAPKNQYNSFGKYSYRSCEDILEAAKPVCANHGLMLILSDEVKQVGDRYYVEATARLYDTESEKLDFVQATASAREADTKKGMDDSQITGTASSYARKYALNGLFNIDDTKDADTNEYAGKATVKEYKCSDCGKPFEAFTDKNGKTWSAGQVYHMSESKNADGKARCVDCRKKHENA